MRLHAVRPLAEEFGYLLRVRHVLLPVCEEGVLMMGSHFDFHTIVQRATGGAP
jgi:hypothetical protein